MYIFRDKSLKSNDFRAFYYLQIHKNMIYYVCISVGMAYYTYFQVSMYYIIEIMLSKKQDKMRNACILSNWISI